MFKRFLGTVASLVVVLIAYSVYALTAAPVIEPAYSNPESTATGSEFYWQTAPSKNRQRLAQVFKEDAWQLKSPKIFEFAQGILLFQEYEQAEGEVIIKPCTCVIFQSTEKKDRILTMHAPSGAVISVDALSSESQNSFNGRLVGDVAIHSHETAEGANDGIQFITRNVQFEENRIWTTHDVEFQYAGHYGKGRDLIVTLGEQEKSRTDVQSDNPLSRIDSFELIHVDELVLQMERQIIPLATPDSNVPQDSLAAQRPSEMVIECDGPFRIDQANSRLSLEEQVQVTFRQDGRTNDTMTCDQLQVTFTPPYAKAPDSDNPLLDTTSQFNPQSIIADGNPVLIKSPSRDLTIQGQRVSIDLEELKFSIKDAVESTIELKDFSIKVPKLEYVFADDPGRLGTYQAEGAGELRLKPKTGSSSQQGMFAQWQAHSTLALNEKQEKVLELNKGARIQLSEAESISSDRLHIWLEEIEIPQSETSKETKVEISPYKMAATGHVEINLPELHAKAHQTHTWITRDQSVRPVVPVQPGTRRGTGTINLLDRGNAVPSNAQTKRYIVSGEILKLDLLQTLDGLQINGATMEGDLSFHQQPLPGQSRSPLTLHGERIRLSRGLAGLAELKIDGKERQGKPAWISYEGFQVSGNSIQLNQQMNLVWIEGAGELVHLAPNDPNPDNAKRITWDEQLAFTGSKIQLFGNVQSRFRMQTTPAELNEIDLACNILELHLTHRVDFQNPQLDAPIEIQEFKAVENVNVQRRTIVQNKQHRNIQHIQVDRLSYFPAQNNIAAFGQGQIRYTALDDGSLPTIGKPTNETKNIQSLVVDFNEGLTGNLTNLNLTFQGKVQTLMGSVPRWDSPLTSKSVQQSEGVELNCDSLSIANISRNKEPSFVISATGNTYIHQSEYTALAHRISYSQLKNNIVMEGGRGDAKLWMKANKTPTPNAAARRIIYDLETGKVDVHSPSFLDSGR